MARDEDIFKKLNKQKPLVKQINLQPLSNRDFTPPKTTLSIPVEYAGKGKRREVRREPSTFQSEAEREKYSRAMKREPAALEYGSRAEYKKNMGKAPEVKRDKPSVSKPDKQDSLDVFTDNVKPQKQREPAKPDIIMPQRPYERTAADTAKPQRPYEPPQPSVNREYTQDISYLEEAKQSNGFSLRHELKYYINYRDYVMLRGSLKALMSPDPFAGEENSYHVRSLYFDDINETALREKIAGSDNRRKYRIRIYNLQDDTIKFEKKYKVGQYIGKKSIRLSRDEYDSIISGDYGFLLGRREELAKELYLEFKGGMLRPRVIVDYMREAYVSPFENCRVTFDKDLKASIMLRDIFDENAPIMPMYESGVMVLEVKFDKFLPVTIKRVLNTLNAADRSAISKYVISRKFE